MPADPASASMTEAPVSAMARRGLWLACVVLAIIALPILVDRLVYLPLRVSLNPNEGWNALHTAAWLAGRPLYVDPTGLILNNYPPLSFGVVALLGRFTGDLIIAGRILSLVSLLAIATLGSLIAGERGASRAGRWFTALLILATFLVGYMDYVAMNDPQMFGLALATLAAWVLVRNWESRTALLGALVLMLLAGLVKHNLMALPIATLFVMLGESRQRGITTLVAGAALAVFALLAIRVTWGADAIGSLLAARQWAPIYLAQNVQRGLPILALSMAITIAAARLLDRQGPERLLLTWSTVALAVGLFTSTGAGVFYNCFFELAVATSILAGLLVERLAARVAPAMGSVMIPLAATMSILTLAMSPLLRAKWDIPGGDAAALAAISAGDIARLRGVQGPVACETAALCYWAGKGFEVDFFNARQAILTGRAGPENLEAQLRKRRFRLVQLVDRNPGIRLSPPAPGEMAVLDSNYAEVHHSATGLYLVPR